MVDLRKRGDTVDRLVTELPRDSDKTESGKIPPFSLADKDSELKLVSSNKDDCLGRSSLFFYINITCKIYKLIK